MNMMKRKVGDEEIEIDLEKVAKLRRIIYGREVLNIRKAEPKKNNEMTRMILGVIENEVKKDVD